MIWFTVEDERDLKELSRDALDRARAIDKELYKISLAEGFYAYYILQDYPQALVHFNLALEQAPNDGDAVFAKAVILRRLGKWDECLALIRKATQIDPLNTAYLYTLATTYGAFQDYEALWDTVKKLEQLNGRMSDLIPHTIMYFTDYQGDLEKGLQYVKTQEIDRSSPIFYYNIVGMFIDNRKWEEGKAYLRNVPPDFNLGLKYSYIRNVFLAQLYWHGGEEERAREIARESLAEINRARNEPSFHLSDTDIDNFLVAEAYIQSTGLDDEAAVAAVKQVYLRRPVERDAIDGAINLETLARIYARIGDAGNAVPIIQRLLNIPSALSWFDASISPDFDPIRDDPDFQQILATHKPQRFQ